MGNIEDIESYEIIKDNDLITYDFEVEDNHNYILKNTENGIVVHNSGKSFAVAFAMVNLTYSQYQHKILYLRQIMTTLEDSSIADIRNAIQLMNAEADFKEAGSTITNIRTGSSIIFKGIKTSSGKQTAKLKSISGITTLVVEEAEELESFDEFSKIDESIRIKGKPLKIILVYNPGSAISSWIHREWFKEGIPNQDRYHDTMFLHSTFLDNIKNLHPSVVQRYKDLERTNPTYYRQTILAEWTLEVAGRIYAGWGECDFFDNEEDSDIWYGMDFGYGGKDHTSLIKIYYFEGVYFIQEMFSEPKLTIKKTMALMRKHRVPYTAKIYADSAMPLLIEELRQGGYLGVQKARKGSVEQGIKKVQDKDIVMIDAKNSQLYYDYMTFKRDDKDKLPHEPDALAALRYGINSRRPIENINKKIVRKKIHKKGFLQHSN